MKNFELILLLKKNDEKILFHCLNRHENENPSDQILATKKIEESERN